MTAEQLTQAMTQLSRTTAMLANIAGHSMVSQATAAADAKHAMTGREMSKILQKPEVFNGTREQECAVWPAWSWALDQYLSVLDQGFVAELKYMRANHSYGASCLWERCLADSLPAAICNAQCAHQRTWLLGGGRQRRCKRF